MKIAAIARNPMHSPNMTANDTAILECTAHELRNRGIVVTMADEQSMPHDADAIFHMSRSHNILQHLKDAEKSGIMVINSPEAVENCSRSRLMQCLDGAGIPQPAFTLVNSCENLDRHQYPAWIKRADGWSSHSDDVCFAPDAAAAAQAIEAMHNRGIAGCIHCKHIEGDIIKFYGIGNRFFHYSYPDPEKSKFGLEKINGTPHRYPFSIDQMKETVYMAAEAIGLEIYGGDCIVDSKGNIFIIDLNDFPSFSAIRPEAAKEIAEYIMEKIKQNRI